MNSTNKLRAFLMAAWWFVMLDLMWMGLETLFYGTVQYRVVDDIISIPIFYSLYLNGLNYVERNYLR